MRRVCGRTPRALQGLLVVVLASVGGGITGCGDDYLPIVAVSPDSTTALLGREAVFTATVIGRQDKSVTWTVNGQTGGDEVLGTIAEDGVYTAPGQLPEVATVKITAACTGDPAVYGEAWLTIVSSALIVLTPDSSSVGLEGQVAFSAEVIGPSDKRVSWAVNGLTGGDETYGTITEEGLYTAPTHFPDEPNVKITAVWVGDPSFYADAYITIVNSIYVEMEDFLTFHDEGGSKFGIVPCSAASGGHAVEGFDLVGEYMTFQVAFEASGLYAATLRQAAMLGAHNQVGITLDGAGPGGSNQETYFDIVGRGIT